MFQQEVNLIIARIQAFSENEILSMIDGETLGRIKLNDPHPFFQMYSVCHDGVSRPKLLGDTGSRPIHWTKRAVQSLKNIVLKGVKFFRGHNKDNSITDRPPIGEVVANKEIEIDGKLNHIVIAYHKPEVVEEVKKYDICSQEGIWNFIESAGSLLADSVEKITGIALANSGSERPAFEGAKRLGMIQAFETTDVVPDGKGKKMEITFNDVKEFIETRNILPSRLYDVEAIKADKKFFVVFQDNEEKIKTLEKQVQDLNGSKESLTKDKNDLEGKLKDFVIKENRATIKERFIKFVDDQKGLTDLQKTYVKGEFEWLKPEAMSDQEIYDFVDKTANDKFKIIAPVLTGNKNIIPIVTPEQNKQVDPTDMSLPENNDMIAVEE